MSSVRKRILLAFHWYMPGLHEGALKYCAEKGWSVAVLTAENAAVMKAEQCDGILSTLSTAENPLYDFAANANVPMVELSGVHPRNTKWGRYPSDGLATGRVAAEYLRRRPVASFAFVAHAPWTSNEARREGFHATLAATADDRPVSDFYTRDKGTVSFDLRTGAVMSDAIARRELAEFLKRLPRPVGVFGSVDETASQVIEAAMEAGLKVPGDVYLLGYGNRELLSRMSPVPLSSITVDYNAWAYAAMGMLDGLISGRIPPGETRYFPPGGVIERESTGGESGGDPLCEQALALMREHVSDPLEVPALAARLGVSKSKLNTAFSESYGTGVAKRYLLLRLEIAKGLLSAGDKVESVAAAVGFASSRSLRAAFVTAFDTTPGDYARRARDVGSR